MDKRLCILGFIIFFSSTLIASSQQVISSLRLKSQPSSEQMYTPPRQTVHVSEDLPENVLPHFQLIVEATVYGFQHNINEYMQDIVNYATKLGSSLQRNSAQGTNDDYLFRQEASFNASVAVFNSKISVLKGLNRMITLKKQMIVLVSQIDARTKLAPVRASMYRLEQQLRQSAISIVEMALDLSSTQRSHELRSLAYATIESNSTNQQILQNTTAVKLQLQRLYLDEMMAARVKLVDLYSKNRQTMVNISAAYEASTLILNPTTAEQFRVSLGNTDRIIGALELGFELKRKALLEEISKYFSVDREREALDSEERRFTETTSNCASFLSEARNFQQSVLPQSDPKRQFEKQLSNYARSLNELTAAFRLFKEYIKPVNLDFHIVDNTLTENQRSLNSLQSIAKDIQTATENLIAIKFGSVQLQADFDKFNAGFPQLLRQAMTVLKTRISQTAKVDLQMERKLGEMKRTVVTEPLRRTLERFLLEQSQTTGQHEATPNRKQSTTKRSQLRVANQLTAIPLQPEANEARSVQVSHRFTKSLGRVSKRLFDVLNRPLI